MDYVRIMRTYKHIAWEESLEEEDLPFLSQRIDLLSWYPMDSYERMGLAILERVAQGNLDLIHQWGRATVDVLEGMQPDVIARGDPRETFARFDVLRRTLFDFPAVRSRFIRDGRVIVEANYGMSARAEEAACHQSLGFLERLLELSGAEEIELRVKSRSWEGDDHTAILVCWRPVW